MPLGAEMKRRLKGISGLEKKFGVGKSDMIEAKPLKKSGHSNQKPTKRL